MAKLADTTKRIVDGKVLLFRRPRSSLWQAKFCIKNQVVRISTKTDDYDQAVEYATNAYGKARWGAELGLPVISRSFKSIALLARKELQDALDGSYGKPTYKSYITAIDNYLIPFFGSRNIDKIDGKAVKDFAVWRINKLGKKPSHTLVNTHNVALNKVFDTALERSFINQTQVPKLFNDGEQTKPRPGFSLPEYVKLYKFMRQWVKQGKKGKITWKREILRDYVFVIALTGIRPGTETDGLKWKHLSFEVQKGVEYIKFSVDGKTIPGEAVARHSIYRALNRLIARQTKYSHLTHREAIEQQLDAYVFALPNGEEVKNLLRPFEILLDECGLRIEQKTGQNRVLYSLRHFYITQAIRRGMTAAEVAVQCRTSIAMIDAHYFKKDPMIAAERAAGRA